MAIIKFKYVYEFYNFGELMLDDIIEEEFYIDLPLVISKTLISSAAKATALSYCIYELFPYLLAFNFVYDYFSPFYTHLFRTVY